MSSEALERATTKLRLRDSLGGAAPGLLTSEEAAALLAEVARLEQERDYAAECRDNMQGWAKRAEASGREARAALAVAREREQRAVEALQDAEWNGSAWIGLETCPVCGNERVTGHAEDCSVAAALVDEPAAAGAGHNLCACGSTLIVCAKCGDSRCLVCDPYDELDTCGATEPAAATLAEPGSVRPVEQARPGSASAAADEPGETP